MENMNITEYVAALAALVSVCISVLYARRARKADVKAKEAEARAKELENTRNDISNAELMIDLVKKANAEAATIQQAMIASLKVENQKFKQNVEKFEKAILSINRCPHRDHCPVYDELSRNKASDYDNGLRKGDREGSIAGHNGKNRTGQGPPAGASGM